MVFKKFSELKSHLDVGDRHQILRNSDTVFDKLRRNWAKKFFNVNDEEIDRTLARRMVVPAVMCSFTGHYISHEARKSYVSLLKLKADRGKVALDMRTARTAEKPRTARNPDSSHMFERKDWLMKTRVQGFFSRLAAARRRQGS